MQNAMQTRKVRNWFGNVESAPRVVVEVQSVDDVVAVLTDPDRYPSPVRAVGSNHSTTACGGADGGTVVGMRAMNRILEIGPDTVRAEAGALYLDVNQELRRHGRQFHVNVELGNLTIGSAATGGTKDASFPGEYGQVASYAVALTMVTPDGEVVQVTESDPELLQAARSGHGLLGIVVEATFRVRPLGAMRVHHKGFSLDRFAERLPELTARDESLMLYIDPFRERVTVELRRYDGPASGRRLSEWQWRLRNLVWSRLAPRFAYLVTRWVLGRRARAGVLNAVNRLQFLALRAVVRGRRTLPQAQQIRYPEESDSSRYTFSIWAFPEDRYVDGLRRYVQLCRQHHSRTGYRTNLLSVGYRIAADQSSLLSYSYDGPVITFDPVSTGGAGWEEFLREYNDLCSELGGVPLLNQTALLTRAHVDRAFGSRLARFDGYRRRFDPGDRLLNDYFRELLAAPTTAADIPAQQVERPSVEPSTGAGSPDVSTQR